MSKPFLKTQDLRATLEELARFGSPVDLAAATEPVENHEVEIAQVGGIHDSTIFELPDGRVACMANIAVTNLTSRTIYAVDVELRASWCDSRWDWLQPQRIHSQGRGKNDYSYLLYRFPGKCAWELEYDLVINHYLLERRRLPSKRPLEGFLLGIGGLMPAELRHGRWLKLSLAIIGADHQEYVTTIDLRTDRLEVQQKMAQPKSLPLRTSRERRDYSPAGSYAHRAQAG